MPIGSYSKMNRILNQYCLSMHTLIVDKLQKNKKKPWFTDECKIAIKTRKKKQKDFFNKTPTLVNVNNFRIARAKARRTINQCKRKSWKNLNMHTPINKVWNTIRKVKSKGTAEKCKHLKLANHIFTDKKEMTNIIGQTVSKKSSKVNLSPKLTA